MRKITLVLALCFGPIAATASSVESVLPDAQTRGEATFRFLGQPIYEARLLTKGGAAFDWKTNFGLELTYLRALTQFDLVSGTLREMTRIGAPLPSESQLTACFDDVARGDTYLAVSDGPSKIHFYRNGLRACTLAGPRITRGFMSIFLGENARSARFARRLQGV